MRGAGGPGTRGGVSSCAPMTVGREPARTSAVGDRWEWMSGAGGGSAASGRLSRAWLQACCSRTGACVGRTPGGERAGLRRCAGTPGRALGGLEPGGGVLRDPD